MATQITDDMLIDYLFDECFDVEVPTTPGEMRWVPCTCATSQFPPGMRCEVCDGRGKMLTLVSKLQGYS